MNRTKEQIVHRDDPRGALPTLTPQDVRFLKRIKILIAIVGVIMVGISVGGTIYNTKDIPSAYARNVGM